MSRKSSDGKTLPPWATAQPGNRVNYYLKVDGEIFEHPSYTALRPTARNVYLCLIAHCCGQREFACPYTMAEKWGVPTTTYTGALRELQEAGFIRIASGRSSMQPSTITFMEDWKTRTPAQQQRKPRGRSFKGKNPSANLGDDSPQI